MLGNNNGTVPVEACGPLFVSEREGNTPRDSGDVTIQGALLPIVG